MAFLVIVSHVRGNAVFLNDTAVGALLTISSYPSLGMFFFLTGYGLHHSFTYKAAYAQNFFRHRVITFYVDYLFFLSCYLLFHIANGETIRISVLLKSLTWGQTYINNGWYLQTALLVYLAFWLAYRPFFSRKVTYTVLIISWFIYIFVCLAKGKDYDAQFIIAVPLGYLWSVYYESINSFIEKHYGICLIGSLLLSGVTMIYGRWMTTGLWQFVITAVCIVMLCLTVLLLLWRIPIQNTFLHFIGEHSLEIYVFHGMFLSVFGGDKHSWSELSIYFILVVVCTIPTAWIMHKIITKINNGLRKSLLEQRIV